MKAGVIGLPFIVIFVLILGVVLLGILALRGWLRKSQPTAVASDLPSCGSCGYSVRGVSELVCPECGADLKVVGILKPGQRRTSVLAGCLMPLVVTIGMWALAVAGMVLAQRMLPSFDHGHADFLLRPESGEYESIDFICNATWVTPASATSSWSSFDANVTYGSGLPVMDFSIYPSATRTIVDTVDLVLEPKSTNHGASTTFQASIEPDSGKMAWMDANMQWHTSAGRVTQQDILDFLGAHGADTTRPDVQAEAQQLEGFLDEVLQGKNQFQLVGFRYGSYGGGSSGSIGPAWFVPAYFVTWIVLWIITLVVLSRRSIKKHA